MTSNLDDGVAKQASEGFKDSASYDAYRPSYPPEAVEQLLKRLNLLDNAHANIVEVAAGTGKFTELLAARHEAFNILATEPMASMREQLVKKNLPGVEVKEGLATKLPVADEWGDACIAAQSFHWFANEEALREIHRILKARDVFGIIWNVEDYNKPADWQATTQWEQKLNELVFALGSDGAPRFRDNVWRTVFERQLPSNPLLAIRDVVLSEHMPRFSLPLGEDSVKFTVWLTKDALWSRLRTLSQVAILEGQAKEDFFAQFSKIVEEGDVEKNEKGEIALHGVTFFAWTSRL